MDADAVKQMKLASTWSARGPVILALMVSAVLLGTGLLVRRTVSRAWEGAARGLGEAFVVAAREHFAGRTAVPDEAVLQLLLDEHRDEGLRYVGVFTRDGALLAEAGTPLGRTVEASSFTFVGGRARSVRWLPGSSRLREQTGMRAPLMVYEFEPLLANRLRADAQTLLVVTVMGSLAVMTMALWVSRGARARERLHAELERGRRLAALGEMSAVLAHELRNPLASLKGHAQLLVETLGDAGARAKAERVVGESVRLESLANDLLEFVRGGEIRRVPTDPAALVNAAVAEVGAERFVVEVAPGVERWPLDAGRLRQALTNVLRNAAQASPDGVPAQIGVERRGDRLLVTVRDRGPGIPAGEERAIFEPFHTRRARGVGLGLAITRRIVEMHGGTITAANHPEGGAELRIELPRAG